jgi:chromate transporter
MTGLFLTFLKIGAVLYGSGYVLLAFLHADFVTRLGWLSEQQLIDAIAVGQITPGPLFTTATFIGYLLNGVPGAILSTLGIFLPSFVFVALSSPFLPRLRHSTWLGSFLDGVNAASLGLMGVVTWQIIHSTFTDSWSFLLALVAGLFLIRYRVNTTWLILGGALGGFLIRLLT